MKTALFTPLYLDGNDLLGNSRVLRNIRYVEYYESLKKRGYLNFDQLVMCDNGSHESNLKKFMDGIEPYHQGNVSVHCFSDHIARGAGYSYGYAWRALHFMRRLIGTGFDKIVTIDSDGFILSERLATYVNESDVGWEAFWCPKYGFPEAAFHILNRDVFDFFIGFTSTPWQRLNGLIMEKTLPFTKVNKHFVTDRFGETETTQKPEWDYCGQTPLSMKLEFVCGTT